MDYIANPVRVKAERITLVLNHAAGGHILTLNGGEQVIVDANVTARYVPVPGDYYVTQEDGYVYVNPKDVFERKYRQADQMVSSIGDERVANNTMRHQYKVLDEAGKEAMQTVKDLGLNFHNYLTVIGTSRELSLAKTKLEEVVMWAVKHITA